jgi:transcriptional regulator of aromatic amino acid metabolism
MGARSAPQRGEIDSLPLKLQVSLRQFLQPQEIVLLGGARARKLNVRFIAATSRNLADTAQTLHFRQDLHSRLNVVPCGSPLARTMFSRTLNPQVSSHHTLVHDTPHVRIPAPFSSRPMKNKLTISNASL